MTAWLETIPLLLRVLASLGVILLLSRWCRELWVPLLLGTLALAVLSGHDLPGMGAIAAARIFSLDNLLLLLIILMVLWLSQQMAAAELLRDLVEAIRPRVSQRAAMAALPALVGLLPMPGGALFSAPLVDECDTTRSLCSLLKAQVNYWFRHVWEFWWPLYPGVLLATTLSRLELWQFMLIQLPVSAIALAVGWLLLLRRLPASPPSSATGNSVLGGAWALMVLLVPPLLPIAVVMAVYTGVSAWLPAVAGWNRYAPMGIGLLVAMLLIQGRRPLGMAAWGRIACSGRILLLLLVVEVVSVYGAFVEARLPGGLLLVEQLRAELAAAGIPTVAVLMVLPFLCGMTTGLSIGFVGASFPVVMNLVDPNLGFGPHAATAVLAYGCGYYGMILSPVHICLVVTNQHFRTDLIHSLRQLLLPALLAMALIVGYAGILYTWGGS